MCESRGYESGGCERMRVEGVSVSVRGYGCEGVYENEGCESMSVRV